MKAKVLSQIILCLAFFSGTLSSQEWRVVNHESLGSIYDMSYLAPDVLLINGTDGSLLKSVNGGKDWEEYKTSLTKTNTNSKVQIVDEFTWFASTDTFLVRTIDGGKNWETITLPVKSSNIRAIQFVDPVKGWVLTGTSKEAKILFTDNAGANWTTSVITGDIKGMHFFNDKGIAVGGGVGKMELHYTTDGTTWTKAPVPAIPDDIPYTRLDLSTVYMVNEQIAYATGWGTRAAGLQATLMAKTTDGGANWSLQVQSPENRIYNSMSKIYFKDEMNGVAVGGFGGYEGTVIIKTNDGGTTWTKTNTAVGNALDIVHGNGEVLYAAGGSGLVMKSIDFGTTWELVTEMPSSSIYSIVFPAGSENIIYAAGTDGLFLKSTDNGKQWNGKYICTGGKSPMIKDLFFINDKIGFAARGYGLLSKTTDGGETWVSAIEDSGNATYSNESVFFVDENIGFVVGKAGNSVDAIYKTTDCGQTWIKNFGQFNENLTSITFYDKNNGIATGADTLIIYTNDGGNTWTRATVNNAQVKPAAINDVAFLDASTAIAVGNKFAFISNDAGATWDTINVAGISKTLNSIKFKDKDTGIVAGSNIVYMITNSGKDWNVIDEEIFKDGLNYGIGFCNHGHTWITSAGSGIFTNAPLDTTTTSVVGSVKPEFYSLSQNYPNPFNPVTTIEYSLPENNFVAVKVYNVLGKLVNTLVNEEQSAGTHKVSFDATNLSSGMYIYSITVNGKTISRKMTLLK